MIGHQPRALLRRVVPRVIRNWLRSPSRSLAWAWDELGHALGRDPVIFLRAGWSVRAHPAARRAFGIPQSDPSQIAELDAFIASCCPGMMLFDIGAHFGLFSFAALHYGGPTARAVAVDARSYRHVDSILKHGLDRLAPPAAAPQLTLTPVHEHVRGRDYYQ